MTAWCTLQLKHHRTASLYRKTLTNQLSLWASKWQMTFNVTKCKTLSITRKRNPIYHRYSMNNQLLESVRNHPYLGVEVTQKLNWSNHIDHITAKAKRSLGFVKRNLKRCPENIKEQAYKSLVRPHLEYASTVWLPHQKYQIDKLEAVQRKAARFIKNCWSREQGLNSYKITCWSEMGHSPSS